MGYKGCAVGEQKFADEDTLHLRFGAKSGNVEELAICSCVEVNPSSQSLNSYRRSSEKKITKSGGASTHPCLTLHGECFSCSTLKCTVLCVFMEGSDDVQQSWRASNLLVLESRLVLAYLLLTRSNALVRSVKAM